MRLSKVKTSEKIDLICQEVRALVGGSDMDWEKKSDEKGPYYEGELQNLKIYVRPKSVEFGLVRADDKEGKIEEKKEIPVINPKSSSGLFLELEDRFRNHGTISFLKEVHGILTAANQPIEEVVTQDDDDKTKLLRSGK